MTVVVNGEAIEAAEIEAEMERLRPDYDAHVREVNEAAGEDGEKQLREWATENLIERAVVMQAARALTTEIPQEQIDGVYEQVKEQAGEDVTAEEVKADIELRMRVDHLMAEGVGEVAEPTEEDLKAFYEANAAEMMIPEQVHAAHIVKHVNAYIGKEEAYKAILDVKMALDQGAQFDELASQHSDCPDSAGDLGTFGRGQMVQEFEDVVFQMDAGQVSDIFLTEFGYHIAKVHDRVESHPIPFDEVKDRIAEELLERRREEAVETFIDSLKAKATVEGAGE